LPNKEIARRDINLQLVRRDADASKAAMREDMADLATHMMITDQFFLCIYVHHCMLNTIGDDIANILQELLLLISLC